MKLFDLLSTEEKRFINESRYKKGTLIFTEDEKCDSLGIIKEGKIEISSFLEDGDKVIYNTLRENTFFGGNLIFSSDPLYKGDVIALTDCTVLFLSKVNLEKILQKNILFLEEFLKLQSDFAKALNFKIKLLSISSAQERILYYFQYNGIKKSTISVTRLSEELSLTREATSRALTKLVEEKKIIKRDKIIYIKEKDNN